MVITQAEKDRDISFSIINYLSASYRGKLAGYTLLGQLQHSSFDERDIEVIQHATERIAEWMAELARGEVLFCANWETLETFEAQNALGLLEKLKPDLLADADQISLYLEGKKPVDSEAAKWLFSMLIRSSFARDVYLRGFILFGETFNKPEIAEHYGNMLPRAAQHSALVQQGIELFREAEFDLSKLGDGFSMTLMAGCEELPAIFRTHVHDINLLACNFKGGVKFENLDFEKNEASSWAIAGLAPEPAGYWRAYGFDPQETSAWIQSQVQDPGEATAWKMSNRTAQEAKPWKDLGFTFDRAIPWVQAGYVAHIAKEHIDRGITEPPSEA